MYIYWYRMKVSPSVSLFTKIVLLTLPKPLPLTPLSQPSYASSRQTDAPQNSVILFFNSESLQPTNCVGLHLADCDLNHMPCLAGWRDGSR